MYICIIYIKEREKEPGPVTSLCQAYDAITIPKPP